MIENDLLIVSGAVLRKYKKGDVIIREGNSAKFYFQVSSGEVKMVNTGDNGQDFIQGIFHEGESFAEPPLFLEKPYPASAIAITDAEILVLDKNKLFDLLKSNFAVQLEFLKVLSKRIYFKALIAKEISIHDASHRILALIDFLKERDGYSNRLYEVKLTRQQIADLTGLRVETVIRTVQHLTIKHLTKKGKKIFR